MATNAPKIAVNEVIAAKLETTTGTPISLAAADAGLIVRNMKLDPIDTYKRRSRIGGQGNSKGVAGAPLGTATFQIEAIGGGSAATSPEYATTFFPACNLSESTAVWTPADAAATVTIGHYEDGKLKILYGARGDVKLMVGPDDIPVWDFAFQGLYDESADTSLLSSITFPSVLPDMLTRTFTYNSYAAIISRFEFGMGNVVGMRPDAGNAAGKYRSACITDRDPYCTFDPEETATGTIDWDALYAAQSEQAISYVIGATTGNIITIASTKAQVSQRPRDRRDGILTRNIRASLNETATASPFSITFG